MNREFKWAVKTLLEMNNVTASPSAVAAFNNQSANSQWINAIIRGANPQIGSMTSATYDKVMNILRENGIDVNIYGVGNGTGN